MWKFLYPVGIAHLMVAKYKGEIITTWVLFKWHDFLYYPYGASTDKHKEVMANNLEKIMAENEGSKILAIIGAGHEEDIIEIIKRPKISYSVKIGQ